MTTTYPHLEDNDYNKLQGQHRFVDYQGRKVAVPRSNYPYVRFIPGYAQIRLLHFEGRDFPSGRLRYQLRHHRLNDDIQYAALSYWWGDPSLCKIILVDGYEVPITHNLEAALCRLGSDWPVIWVDAVCIDQTRMSEKSTHVPLIKSIYQMASSTVIWLGHAAQGSHLIMNLFHKMANGHVPTATPLRKLRPQIFAFFRREYWARVWIIQEIAVSKKITILCGSDIVPWYGLSEFLAMVGKEKSLLYSNLPHVQHLRLTREAYTHNKLPSLLQVLAQSSSSLATDHRDKVFALFALSSDAHHYVVQPSYQWTEFETCLELTRSAIIHKRSLDIVLTASHDTPLSSVLPTWVPDLLAFGTNAVQRRVAFYTGKSTCKWTATSHALFPPQIPIFLGRHLLRSRGYHLGRIEALGVPADREQPNIPYTKSRGRLNSTQTNQKIQKALLLYYRHYIICRMDAGFCASCSNVTMGMYTAIQWLRNL